MSAHTINLLAGTCPNTFEKTADAADIVVGHLVEITATGVDNASTADGGYSRTFAAESIANASDTDYTYLLGETVRVQAFASGAEVEAVIGASLTIAIGDVMTSAGDGTLKKAGTVAAGAPTFTALEAVTTGAGATAKLRVLVN